VSPTEIKSKIEDAFKRNAELDACRITKEFREMGDRHTSSFLASSR
jgi:hypothetical protein